MVRCSNFKSLIFMGRSCIPKRVFNEEEDDLRSSVAVFQISRVPSLCAVKSLTGTYDDQGHFHVPRYFNVELHG